MKKTLRKFKEAVFMMLILFITHPAWADLPKPPDKDLANSSNDWTDVGGALVFKVIGYTCYALGALILVGVAATVLKAFYVAQEKQDLGHFFKTLIVGLVAAAIGIGLVYGGYQIIPQQS